MCCLFSERAELFQVHDEARVLVEFCATQLRQFRKLYENFTENSDSAVCLYLRPKVRKLLETLKPYKGTAALHSVLPYYVNQTSWSHLFQRRLALINQSLFFNPVFLFLTVHQQYVMITLKLFLGKKLLLEVLFNPG